MSRQRTQAPEYDESAVEPNKNRLRQARTDAKIATREAAKHLGVTVSHVSAIELGKTRLLAGQLRALANYYRKPIDFFFLPDDP